MKRFLKQCRQDAVAIAQGVVTGVMLIVGVSLGVAFLAVVLRLLLLLIEALS